MSDCRRIARLGVAVAAAWIIVTSQPSHAGIVLTDTTNITLAASQSETGGDASENPDVTGGTAGIAIASTVTGSFLDGQHSGSNLDDGDIGVGNASDGSYAISNSATDVILDFGVAYEVTSIAIYNGYTNRDDGSYTLHDTETDVVDPLASTVLGAWTISTPAAGGTNDGADAFWLTFDTPVKTSALLLETTSTDCCGTDSYREIVVYGTVLAPLQLTVDSTADAADANPGDGICATAAAECTLRAAINEANAWPAADHIDVPAGVYPPNALNGGSVLGDITDDVTIQGSGSSCDTGTRVGRIYVSFNVDLDGYQNTVEISQLCVTYASADCQASVHVQPNATLHLRDVELKSSGFVSGVASGVSAGIVNFGRLLFDGGVIRDQKGVCDDVFPIDQGTGLVNYGIATLDSVEITGSGAGEPLSLFDESAGGIHNLGRLTIVNSAIADNYGEGVVSQGSHGSAGGITNRGGTVVASNVSLFDNVSYNENTTGSHGVILNEDGGFVALHNVTLTSNQLPSIANEDVSGSVTEFRNTIVQGTCSGTITTLGHNVEDGTSCGFTGVGDQQNTAVAFLEDTSGPTTTLVPTSGTNVQDLGDDAGCPHMDQRGHYRPPSGGCDIGAAELASAIACANGLDDDGDGFCDTAAGSCTDGSTPGDPACADASDPLELELLDGDVLTSDSDASVKHIDPATGDVQILSRGLGLRDVTGVTAGTPGIFASDNDQIFEIDPQTGIPSILTSGFMFTEPRGLSIDGDDSRSTYSTLISRLSLDGREPGPRSAAE